jgi:hypothetical protein
MTVPRWFYIVVAVSAGLFAGASAFRNLLEIGDHRFSYYAATGSHQAIVFDGRTGTGCEWVPSTDRDPSVFLCLDYPSQRIDVWHQKIVRHFAKVPPDPFAGLPMDTGMKMMDSAALMDSIARADSLR